MIDENDEFTEKIKILATDDEKIKLFGELFTNDSSREILQLLFNEELTATQIAQKTGISLQLVKYHLIKLQDLGIVKISKIEKNSKSQDMKIYTATKFSIVIVPPKLSEKTKESKLLVRSFRHIYKVAGLGIATGLSGLFSLSQFQNKTIFDDSSDGEFPIEEYVDNMQSAPIDESVRSLPASAPMVAESESQELSQRGLDVAETIVDSEISVSSELFLPFLIITIILGGLTVYYFWKFRKSS
ncbi:ArsR/SmtB family transcription factor [Candidatus Nitrosopumilus sediminis]|uniref:ArsR family transcriptional regulator n=1 Tax=Candidatus Nitrosopumilus sediminis TaxID=1229909 RepID=K0BD41_9ARCH|nr:winged helix-turn-helix domain-containing protein [Candidatus Nitrosopumilus sediminis]AFS82286.1 ArsR family transcriptional regulator [Candidatus Nitrosopumilus sediminis]